MKKLTGVLLVMMLVGVLGGCSFNCMSATSANEHER